MTKKQRVTLGHITATYSTMFDHVDCGMQALPTKKTQWQENLYFTMKFAQQILSKYNTEVTSISGMHLISAHILDPFLKFWSFWMWDKRMNIHSEDETSYTIEYQEAFLKNGENEYCTKHQRMSVIKPEKIPASNLVSSGKASGFGESSFDLYDLSSDDEEYLTATSMSETTPRLSDRAVCLLSAVRL